MKQYQWKNLEELFQKLDQSCNYLIMRSYENIKEIDWQNTSRDIDFLCDDYRKMVKVMHAMPYRFYDDKVLYKIFLGGGYIKIDIRSVGDNYYDSLWQKQMLARKRRHADGFFVMNESDQFYSLVYHAILQKKTLTEEYRKKLADMASALGIKAKTEKEFLTHLIAEMKRNKFLFYYPDDTSVICRFYLVPKGMCVGKMRWYLRKVCHFPLRVCTFIYNRIKVFRKTTVYKI